MRTVLLSLVLGAASSVLAASISVLPLGDSITYGYGSSDGNGYREEFYNRVVEAGNEVDMVGSLRECPSAQTPLGHTQLLELS
jgi:hypothetical protein